MWCDFRNFMYFSRVFPAETMLLFITFPSKKLSIFKDAGVMFSMVKFQETF